MSLLLPLIPGPQDAAQHSFPTLLFPRNPPLPQKLIIRRRLLHKILQIIRKLLIPLLRPFPLLILQLSAPCRESRFNALQR